MGERHRILIVDDEPLIRDALASFLQRQPKFEVVGDVDTAARAIAGYLDLRPDVVLMDLHLPGGGLNAIEAIRRNDPQACILVMTVSSSRDDVIGALRAGAAGYQVKNCGGRRLLASIQEAMAGQMPLASSARQLLAGAVSGQVSTGVDFTPRELELLSWLAEGLSNLEIAERMCVSESSVKQYLLRVGDKLGAKGRTQILIYALRAGIVDHRISTM